MTTRHRIADVSRALALISLVSTIIVLPATAAPAPPQLRPSPLWLFAGHGDIEGVSSLLAQGVDVNKAGLGSSTPLDAAVEFRQPEMVKFLLEHGADANDGRGDGGPLSKAITNVDIETAKLLVAHGANTDGKYLGDEPLLCWAEEKRSSVLVDLLVNAGADVNVCAHLDKVPSISLAVVSAPRSVANMIDHGAKVNAADALGQTALMYAVAYGRKDVIKLLLDRGANVNTKDADGLTALELANNGLHPQTLALLETVTGRKPTRRIPLERLRKHPGQPPEMVDKHRLLSIACTDGDIEAITSLVALGANVNAAIDDGDAPLLDAVQCGQVATVVWLLNHNAEANRKVPDDEGEPTSAPTEELATSDDPAMWQAFMSHGVKVDSIAQSVLLMRPRSPLGQFLTAHGVKLSNKVLAGIREESFTTIGGDPEVLRRLLELGMDPNLPLSRPPLTLIAITSANSDCLQILVDHGANPTAVDLTGKTALDYVSDGNHPIASKLLSDAITKWNSAHTKHPGSAPV